ncbi:MAG: polysaccharide biosynthesis protein [Desulfobia sp.]
MFKWYLKKTLINRWMAVFHDLLWVPVAIFCAFWFRFNLSEVPGPVLNFCWTMMASAVPVYMFFFWYFDLYRGIWRFASLPDFIRIIKAALAGTFVIIVALFQYNRLETLPRTVIFLTPLFLICGLSGPRLFYRLLKDRHLGLQSREGQKTLIVGAGQGGELLVRDLLRRPEYAPVAFVDDDKSKQGREIHGVRVSGTLDDIEKLIDLFEVELVLVAIPSAGKEIMQRLVRICSDYGVESRTLPPIDEMTGNEVEAGHLRPLTIEDLLGRDPVCLDSEAIAGCLENKCVLVTGGGGSIGSELCRQIAGQQPSRLIVFDNGKFNLYAIDQELRTNFPEFETISVLGDVKNRERVEWVFRKFRPHVVFHAAAYKHVPMVELNPAEGVNNNVGGTKVVAEAADQYEAERFVLVSTDKAVNPTNVMGTTKRIAELYCQNITPFSKTRFITTRFGNVLGSAGSVVPLFEKQISAGGPVTVTHRDIRRYFMTISEAVSLILQAGAMGKGGEIFVLDMGEPVLIRDLAEQMIRLSGLEPGQDIEIQYTGLRPGEKLYEEVFHEHENLQGTSHPKLQLAGSRTIDWNWLTDELKKLEKAAFNRNIGHLRSHLQAIVPEYDLSTFQQELEPKKKNEETGAHLEIVR